MREDWIEIGFKDIVDKIATSNYKVKQKDYLSAGDFPIIDQGQELIGGYENDEKKVLECDLPLVVFGDHTRCVKFINFQFIPGADGIKVLLPKIFIAPKFLYYVVNILANKIENKGYARHYQLLEKQLIGLPPLPEQRAIVKKLESLFSSLDAGVADLKKAQQQLKIYRQAVLKKAFEGELTKEWREKNGLDFSLQNIKIIDLGNIVTGNTPSKSDVNNYKSEEYNFYKPTDLNKGLNINFSIDKVSAFAYEKSRKVYKDSILVTCIGATIGKTGLITKEGIFNQQINAIIPNEKYISKFIYFQIISSSFQNLLISKSSSTTMPIINKSKFQDLDFVAFSLSEQNEIVKQIESRLSVCDSIEQNIKESLIKAEALRQSILKKAFEGNLLTAQELAECKMADDYEPASVLLERIKAEQTEIKAKPSKKKPRHSVAKSQ